MKLKIIKQRECNYEKSVFGLQLLLINAIITVITHKKKEID